MIYIDSSLMMGEKVSSSPQETPVASFDTEQDAHEAIRQKEENDKVARILRP